MKVFRSHMLICGGTGCHASGSIDVRKALVAEGPENSRKTRKKVGLAA